MNLRMISGAILAVGWGLTAPWAAGKPYAIAGSPFAIASQRSAQLTSLKVLQAAYQSKQSNIQVLQEGKVIKILADDNAGSRHQRFLLQLASDQTLLIAHNIDLAPRLANLKVGDKVRFYGEYEWNDQGGVIHWTHRDRQGRHIDGWLELNGKRYQ